MEEIFTTEDALMQAIIDVEGDCIKIDWCMMCPFSHKCVSKAISEARLLPKEDRVRLAYDKLFIKVVDEELSDE